MTLGSRPFVVCDPVVKVNDSWVITPVSPSQRRTRRTGKNRVEISIHTLYVYSFTLGAPNRSQCLEVSYPWTEVWV